MSLKLIQILVFTTFCSQNVFAQSFEPAQCESNNFGQITQFLTIEPTGSGLDTTIYYNRALIPLVLPEIQEHLASKLLIQKSNFDQITLHFNSDQCSQHPEESWIVQCISDNSSNPNSTIEVDITLKNGEVVATELETRFSIDGTQFVTANGTSPLKPRIKMNVTKPHPNFPGSIVLASSSQENLFGYCLGVKK